MSAPLRPAGPADAAAVARVWTRAMAAEPMAQWPLTTHAPAAALEAMFAQLAADYVAAGAVWVDDEVRAAAAWLPPDVTDRIADVDERVHAAVAPHTDDAGRRYERFWEWVTAEMPGEPVWFLDVLAVDPPAQGSGLGGALLRHGLALAARAGLPAFLETGTPANVGYYRRFGFEVWREAEAPDGGPTVWFLVNRTPGAAAGRDAQET